MYFLHIKSDKIFPVNRTSPSFQELEKEFPFLQIGGRYKPPDCIARHRVAIIVPYRNREENLKNISDDKTVLIKTLHLLTTTNGSRFNRGLLLNIGYTEALKLYDYQCFVFHDVDKVPIDLRNVYSCPTQPRHLSTGIDYFRFSLFTRYFVIYNLYLPVTKQQRIWHENIG
ncbi:hypothetical protein KUTeg_014909 [Tegillarca granosa]|uniref:Galactosyltransferase N-terminal domain-containing protein n=1 Tax=Tegillarca granosa TaxID=220873 RepID=A0ABQ9ETU5_TEGGR|nr:hypothetical protein KUTeg_014909 [Tegillarca granosa]